MSRVAIIAAMKREVAPLIRDWAVRTVELGGHRYQVFEKGDAVLVCAGIGAESARRATEAMLQEGKPALVLSVGFAGALDTSLQAGDIVEPRTIINSGDGVRTEINAGMGILVSSANVADAADKARLRKAYGAVAVDMEAAAVALGARARGVEFAALKAISDAADFSLPTIDRFVTTDGRFRAAGFALHVLVRPWLWPVTWTLAQNSSKAAAALKEALERYLAREIVRPNAWLDASNLRKGVVEYAGAHTPADTPAHTQGH
jgi:nucleoside phosphorylase